MFQLIDDTLKALRSVVKYNRDASYLVWGTGAHESMGWTKRRQMGGGPALGYWQMEPNTFKDIVENYLKYHPTIADRVKEICHISVFSPVDLLNNDKLAICMCRIHYLRVREPLPTTLDGMARYWKKYYNTEEGKGTIQEFLDDYYEYSAKEALV
jgi:hypothetical protein